MAFGDFTVTRASTKNILGSAGLYVSVANNVPAFEFNTDGSYRGLLVEPGATNQIRNNSMTDAVAGSPGTLPTNWGEALQGLTRQVVGTGTELGVTYIDVRFSGTATASADVSLAFETNAQIVATNGQQWTNSFWIKKVAEPNAPNDYRMTMEEWTAAAGFIKSASQIIVPTTSLIRYEQTRALDGGGTVARVRPLARFNVTNGNTYDFTVRIGWPQMETGSVATSPIVTTAGTASRVADVVSLASASSVIGQASGTMFIDFIPRSTGTDNRSVLQMAVDGTNSRRLKMNASGAIEFRPVTGGTGTTLFTTTQTAITTHSKVAVAYANLDTAMFYNGVQVGATNTTYNYASGTFDSVGLASPNLGVDIQLNGWMRSVALFPTRLANAQLASITTL